MTLQQMADYAMRYTFGKRKESKKLQITDYAMEYLDKKDIPADYDVFHDHIIVYFKDKSCTFNCDATKLYIESCIYLLINGYRLD